MALSISRTSLQSLRVRGLGASSTGTSRLLCRGLATPSRDGDYMSTTVCPQPLFDYDRHCEAHLASKKRDGSYRIFNSMNRLAEHFPAAETKSKQTVTVWCANDYLGMSRNPTVLKAVHKALDLYGAGSGGTRNISGHNGQAELLETTVAALHRKQAALVFSSCFVANDAALSTLGSKIPGCVYISDELNHASMIEGIRHSKARKIIFKHNDLEDLERILQSLPLETPKIIAFESVYSMSGSVGKIREICALARRYGALTFLDEVHAVGIYGKTGAGVAEHLDWDSSLASVVDEVDIISGTFGKAYGNVGGYIAASAAVIDFVRSYAPGFIFTTSLPPAVMAGATAAIKYQQLTLKDRQQQQLNTKLVKNDLENLDLPIMSNPSHIIPILVGDAALAKQASDLLMSEFGVYVQAINFPTVSVGTERLRITPTPGHKRPLQQELAYALNSVWDRLGLKRKSHWLLDPATSSEVQAMLENNEPSLWTDRQLTMADATDSENASTWASITQNQDAVRMEAH